MLLHDIGWPYGRRDLYYDPDSIPEEHRKPYDKKGMLPSVPDLVEEGGMNRHLNNAVREHEPNDGVLTAIEDFLGASQYELDLLELPGVHGLGILTPTPLKRQNPDLARLLSELDFPPLVVRYVQGVERGPTGTAGASARGTQGAPAAAGGRGRNLREDEARGWRKNSRNLGKSGERLRKETRARVKYPQPGRCYSSPGDRDFGQRHLGAVAIPPVEGW